MAEIALADLSTLIGDIYDCALDPSLWPAALEGVSKIVNTGDTVLLTHDPTAKSAGFLYHWGIDPSRMAAYVGKYAAINPLLTAGWHTEIDEPIRLRSFMDPEDFRRTRFYEEFFAPAGWCDIVGATIQKSAHRYTVISANRGEEAGMAGERELELMGLLAPHVRRAVTIHDALDAKGRRISNLAAALDLTPSAIFLLDGEGRLSEANRAAERFLAHEGAAALERGRLVFADPDLRARIAAAVAASAAGDARGASAMARSRSGRDFALEMLPLTCGARLDAATGGAVLALFLQEIGALEPLPGEVLVKLYGLTPAETRLLALLGQAMSLREAAETLGIRETTARTQLQSVFAKTGTSRQAEVVRLVMSALPRAHGA